MIVETHHICYDSGALALFSEIVTVKSGIGIEKKGVGGNTSVSHHAENLVKRSPNLMHIMMLAGFWLRYSHRNTLTVSDEYSVGSLRGFVRCTTNFLTSAPCYGMAAIKVGAGEVYLVAIASKKRFPAFLPRTVFAPLPKLPEDCFIMEDCFGEDCHGGNYVPLTACLELIQYDWMTSQRPPVLV